MRHCARCLYPVNHPLGLVIDDQGVCSGCRVHEEKDSLDWSERFQRLRRLVDGYRNQSTNNFDCVVPVSGARDSHFIVDIVVRKLGLNPLLVSYNRQYNTAVGHRNLAYLRTIFDADYYQQTLSPPLVRQIMQATLERMGSFHWHVLAGQTVFPVQVAVRFKIPLIIWGTHQGLDQVGMYSHLDEVEMSRRYRKNHDLMGIEGEDLVSEARGLYERDLQPLFYPHDKDIEKVGVRGIFLGNYIRWDSKAQHEAMIERYGYETAPQARTFDTYNDVDCVHYSGLHDLVKQRKYGYGKAVDHACREIRLRRLDRDGAITLVQQYETTPAPDAEKLFAWLGITERDFWSLIDRHRDPRAAAPLLNRFATGRSDLERQAALDVSESCHFRIVSSHSPKTDAENCRLFARGYVNGVPAISMQQSTS